LVICDTAAAESLDDHRFDSPEIGYQGILVDHFYLAQYGRRIWPANPRVESQYLPVDTHELRKSLRQYAEVTALDLAVGCIEHDDARPASRRRNFLAHHALE
jgi:hypothetical protein